MAVCVVIHAGGLTAVLRRRGVRSMPAHAWGWTWLFIRVAGWIILLHLMEITAWALLYYWREAVPDLQDAQARQGREEPLQIAGVGPDGAQDTGVCEDL